MPDHQVTTSDEWRTARMALLEREREHDQLGEDITRQRRELPWVRVDKKYTFDTEDGPKTLAELFDGRSRLIGYHVMFGPKWAAPCPGCASLLDQLDRTLAHVNDDDVTLIGLSHAPIEKLSAYKERRGWQLPYVSTHRSDFGYDFNVSFTEEQRRAGAEYNFERVDFDEVMKGFADSPKMDDIAASMGIDLEAYVTTEGPGLFAFALEDGDVYLTYSAYAPEVNILVLSARILDRVSTA